MARLFIGAMAAMAVMTGPVAAAAKPVRASDAVPTGVATNVSAKNLPSRASRKAEESSDILPLAFLIPAIIGAVVAGAVVVTASSDSNG
ncbi:hypothetical protein [Croceicoccus bisphenolivorans]|uniref:hypothetical protein n=1 Tax=Croceicoccus bisphenolivorans TaxID=1783232 RepID=UPI000A9CF661|nr:hypothetical protein [Croceicoccus bisphenolivorans]